jgi:hypothetical protein
VPPDASPITHIMEASMFKFFILPAAIVALALPSSAIADVQFRGKALYTAVSPKCDFPFPGYEDKVLFHPKTVAGGSNANFSSLTYFTPFGNYGTYSHRLPGGNFGGTAVFVENEGIGWSDFHAGNTSTKVKIADLPAISTSTTVVTFHAEVTDPAALGGDQSNCVVNYVYTGVRE